MQNICNDIKYIGVNDTEIDLFEGMYSVKKGISYNSYVIIDEKIAVFDTADAHFTEQWLNNLDKALGGKKPDYLIISHMEPDHSANIASFVNVYPEAQIVGNRKTFIMLDGFFGSGIKNRKEVADGETLSLGKHTLKFIFAPMVHWPEVMVTYDSASGVLFSADAFGTFDLSDGVLGEEWDNEARRYYFGIVGKYGAQVTSLLGKLSMYDIKSIYPLHGPAITGDIARYIDKYCLWAGYKPESDGVMIAYSSVYGHTARAAKFLADNLRANGCTDIRVCDLAREDRSMCVAEAFKYGKLVLATTTYNADIFPAMREFITCLTERNYQNRMVAFIENGSWMPMAARLMRERFEKSKNLRFAENNVSILSELSEDNVRQLSLLAAELCK